MPTFIPAPNSSDDPLTHHEHKPDFSEENMAIQDERAERRLRNKMAVLYADLTAEDFAQLGPHGGKTEYKGQPGISSPSKKPYRLQAMFQGVEAMVDFKAAMATHDYEAAKEPYFIIKRMLGH